LESSAGISPVKALSKKDKPFSRFSEPISRGIDPDKRFDPRSSTSSCDSLPNSEGIVDSSSLLKNVRCVKEAIDPSVDATVPSSLLAERSRWLSSVRLLKNDGIVPLRRLRGRRREAVQGGQNCLLENNVIFLSVYKGVMEPFTYIESPKAKQFPLE
jgi:hypothetical protein